MIFVTVGTQMPFDRLIKAVDQWAGLHSRDDVFAQIGNGTYAPRNFRWTRRLSPSEFREEVAASSVIVAHAGMGSILTALEFGKPLLVMPRRGYLKETRNDHQWGTAQQLAKRNWLSVAEDESHLAILLDSIDQLVSAVRISPWASEELIGALTEFINS